MFNKMICHRMEHMVIKQTRQQILVNLAQIFVTDLSKLTN